MVLAQDLRKSVLRAAIQGLLTEQFENDSSVSELIEKIKDKKELLIKNKKINREKPFSNIEKFKKYPFEIPANWRFERLGSLMINRDSERIPISSFDRKTRKKIYDYYGASGVIDKIDDYIFDKKLLLIGEDGANLLSRSSPIAFIADGKYWVNNHAHVLDVCCGLNMEYIELYINSINLSMYVTGTAQPKMNQTNMNSIWIAVPPIEEQQRIVDRVNELMERIDEYEKVEKELLVLEQKFPDDMKNALLQAAMQGKLTEQLDSDSSVDEMLEAIKEEKKQLLKEKKIKKEKPLPLIKGDEIPFEIPGNWRWVRLAKIGEIIGGGTPKTTESAYWNNGSIPWITPADMNGCGMFIGKGNKSITKEGLANSSAQLIPKDSVVISSRAPIGYISIAENELSTSQGCKTFSAYCKTKVLSKYIYFVIIYSTSDLIKRATGTTFKEISAKGVGETIIPLPPIEEQQRIVEKLEQLLLLCETL